MLFLTLGSRVKTPIYQKIICINIGVLRKISTYARATLETSQLLESRKTPIKNPSMVLSIIARAEI